MPTDPHAAFFEYHQRTKTLDDLSDRQKVRALKLELFHALQRGHDFQDRSRALEDRVTSLEAELAARDGDALAIGTHRLAQRDRVQSEIAETRQQHEADMAVLRLDLLSTEALCEALAELLEVRLSSIPDDGAIESSDGDSETPMGRESQAVAS